MRLALVHHADAVGPDVDSQRPLSERGRAQARQLADRLTIATRELPALSGWMPTAIWHSGKLRARQTAEAFVSLNPFAEFKAVPGLRPDDPAEIFMTRLADQTADLIVVSHMPLLPALRRRLAAVEGAFPLHGLVLLDQVETGWQQILVIDGEL